MNRKILLLLAMASLLAFQTAHAEKMWCTGNVTEIMKGDNGNLLIGTTWHDELMLLCNTNNTINGIDPVTCLNWYSMAKTAYIHGKTMTVRYETDVAVCSDLPFEAPYEVPLYLHLR